MSYCLSCWHSSLQMPSTFSYLAQRKTSDILARASTGLALASLELQHQAQEAQVREVEAEKRRLQKRSIINISFRLQKICFSILR